MSVYERVIEELLKLHRKSWQKRVYKILYGRQSNIAMNIIYITAHIASLSLSCCLRTKIRAYIHRKTSNTHIQPAVYATALRVIMQPLLITRKCSIYTYAKFASLPSQLYRGDLSDIDVSERERETSFAAPPATLCFSRVPSSLLFFSVAGEMLRKWNVTSARVRPRARYRSEG